MRWLRGALVALLLAAPVVVVAVIAWPEDDEARADVVRPEGSGPDGALVAGDSVEGEVAFGEVATYRVVGTGSLQIDVHGNPPMDATLNAREDDGTETYNDDTNGLDPQVTVDLDDGEEAVVEVRDLGSNAGTFVISVE